MVLLKKQANDFNLCTKIITFMCPSLEMSDVTQISFDD